MTVFWAVLGVIVAAAMTCAVAAHELSWRIQERSRRRQAERRRGWIA